MGYSNYVGVAVHAEVALSTVAIVQVERFGGGSSRGIVAKYHDLWHVEQSFRMSRTDLRARPMFHRTRDTIEAHLTIVFAALAVALEVQDRTGLGWAMSSSSYGR